MYVTLHGAIGASLALAVVPENIPAAFFLGWASHYLADAIPHGDEFDESRLPNRQAYLKRMLRWGGGDLALLTMLAGIWVWLHGWSWLVFLAAFGAILPDLLWGFEALINRKFLGPLGKFHSWIHNPLDIRLPLWFGLAFQAVAAALLWGRLLWLA
jgi:hypothetical protein